MSISPEKQRPSPRRGLVSWIRAAASRFSSRSELQGIDRDEFEQIARELKLSAPELYVLSGKTGLTGDLLKRRLAEFKLSSEFLRERHPDVLRDLERVCGNCASTEGCASEFGRAIEGGEGERSDYCPNTSTLQALKSEADQLASATIPIGPCCC
jgi:hypothetical protein